MKELNQAELKELIIKCWMTHDGMWFMHTAQNCGFEKANLINKAAVRSMAKLEMHRLQQALDFGPVRTPQDFQDMILGINHVIKADFMDFDYSFPREDTLRIRMNRCFAHDGMARLDALEQYQCGIFERFFGWFDHLGLKYQAVPQVEKCLMYQTGSCVRDIMLEF